jgi:hypothetical protein
MTIYIGSRYDDSIVDFFSVTPNGPENPTVFYDFPDLGFLSFFTHTYVSGERLDQIAHRYYRRPSMWWYILDYNPEISDPLNIAPGTLLRIPNV